MSYTPHLNETDLLIGKKFIKAIHDISKDFESAKAKENVYEILSNRCVELLSLVDCTIYELQKGKELVRKNSHFRLASGKEHYCSVSIEKGLIGACARTNAVIVVDDTSKDVRHLSINPNLKSEICVPINYDGKVIAVLSSEHPKIAFFQSPYPEIFELLGSIAGSAIHRIEAHHKIELEVEKTNQALESAIETVSDQFALLKHSKDKQDILLREVHHRVNNNLQIITSIVHMHMDSEKKEGLALDAIHSRLEALSLIHLNIYKTVEMNRVDLTGFLEDLNDILRGKMGSTPIRFSYSTNIQALNLNTLVPLGMLITEIVLNTIEHAFPKSQAGLKTPEIKLKISKDSSERIYLLELEDNGIGMKSTYEIIEGNGVGSTLIQAYIDQLNGQFRVSGENGLHFSINFEDI